MHSDSILRFEKSIFEENLVAVENNITEEGEHIIIRKLKNSFRTYLLTFEKLKNFPKSDSSAFVQKLIPEYSETRDLIVRLVGYEHGGNKSQKHTVKNHCSQSFRAYVNNRNGMFSHFSTVLFQVSF
ncbi:MAG: hypothetical protein HC831_25085 [Chloroflexia bacterium]|nr:hypothetical protein [Chloroflexia bacterium]